jgi:predicted ATPase
MNNQTVICVKGFRSLIDFHIEIAPGINLLVGPNGSGKTNFIEFLDFLNRSFRGDGISMAVSTAGGVFRVFSIENQKKKSPSLTCKITGVAKFNERDLPTGEQTAYFNYSYYLEIKYSKKTSSIYIPREEIKFYQLRSIINTNNTNVSVGAIKISRKSPSADALPKVTIGPRLRKSDKKNPVSQMRRIYKSNTSRDIFEKLGYENLANDESILSRRRILPAIDGVFDAVTRGRSFNVVPDKVRQPDDLTRPPVIISDGSGLTSTLYHLKQFREDNPDKRYYLGYVDSESFGTIVEWTRMVFPNLNDLNVTPDPLTGKYAVQLIVGSEKQTKIPLNSTSDGTVKWLSLITLILTGGGSYSLEEPENFLHPTMQRSLIDIVRETIEIRDKEEKFIFSTHSETMINSCQPEEIILFRYTEEGTKSSRIANVRAVREEINKSGFGLGHYYVNNALN